MGSTKLLLQQKNTFFLNISRCLVAYFRGAMKKLQKGQMLSTFDPINTGSDRMKDNSDFELRLH